MKVKPLDATIMNVCTFLEDAELSRYTEVLGIAMDWIRKSDNMWGATPSVEAVDVVNQKAEIPAGFTVGRVGINVNGSFTPLLPNNQMVDTDLCGTFTPPNTGHPDYPAYNIPGNPQPATFGPLGYDGWFSNVAWGASQPYWPGQGGGKSVHGYYKIIDHKNYIIFDSIAGARQQILLEGTYATWVPGRVTFINDLAFLALKNYCIWMAKMLDKSNDALMYQGIYNMEFRNMWKLMNGEPLCVLVAACLSGYGKIGNGV